MRGMNCTLSHPGEPPASVCCSVLPQSQAQDQDPVLLHGSSQTCQDSWVTHIPAPCTSSDWKRGHNCQPSSPGERPPSLPLPTITTLPGLGGLKMPAHKLNLGMISTLCSPLPSIEFQVDLGFKLPSHQPSVVSNQGPTLP